MSVGTSSKRGQKCNSNRLCYGLAAFTVLKRPTCSKNAEKTHPSAWGAELVAALSMFSCASERAPSKCGGREQ